MTIYVNGPINVVNLSGTIYGIKKNVQLFMDVHVPVEYETQCSDYNSINFPQYFVEKMKNADKTKFYDFFLETTLTNINAPNKENKERYYDKINKNINTDYTSIII